MNKVNLKCKNRLPVGTDQAEQDAFFALFTCTATGDDAARSGHKPTDEFSAIASIAIWPSHRLSAAG